MFLKSYVSVRLRGSMSKLTHSHIAICLGSIPLYDKLWPESIHLNLFTELSIMLYI